MTDGQVTTNGDDATWTLNVPVSPRRRSNYTAWVNRVPVHETRSWLVESTPSVLQPDAAVEFVASDWTVATNTVGENGGVIESIGGAGVDLETGALTMGHGLTIDMSGGASELAIPGLIYNSGTTLPIFPTSQAEGGPVVRTRLSRSGTAGAEMIETVTATLTWYDHFTDQTSVTTQTFTLPPPTPPLAFTDDFVIALRPEADKVPVRTGVYHWSLQLEIDNSTSEPMTLTHGGETAVVVRSSAPSVPYHERSVFGDGWDLAGVPHLVIDPGHPDTTKNTSVNNNDKAIFYFPGETPQLFDFSPYHGNQNATLSSLDAGTGKLRDAQQFGALQGKHIQSVAPEVRELTYKAPDGTEYVFKDYSDHNVSPVEWVFLIDRIEQPGVDFGPDIQNHQGRRGLSFNRTQTPGANFGRLEEVISSDGGVTQVVADANGIIDRLIVNPGANQRVIDFTVAGGNLTEIRHVNDMAALPGVEIRDAVRRFGYHNHLLTSDEWLEDAAGGNGVGTLQRSTTFEYDHAPGVVGVGVHNSRMVSRITTGTGADQTIWDVEPAALAALRDSNQPSNSINAVTPNEIRGTVTQTVTNLTRYVDNDTHTTADDSTEIVGGTYTTEVVYDLAGRTSEREFRLDDTILNHEEWTYDHLDSPTTHTDLQQRRTYFKYDYEIGLSYASEADDVAGTDDAVPMYDPGDYRGNVVQIIAPNGRTQFEHETDNEREDAVGRVMKSVDVRNMESIYKRGKDGRTRSLQIARGTLDPNPENALIDDFFEQWAYYGTTLEENEAFGGLLKKHTSTLGLETRYENYDGFHRPERIDIVG